MGLINMQQNQMDVLIKNGEIINSDDTLEGDVLIRDGVIAQVGENIHLEGAEVIDAKGNYVIPGGIDVHTHLNMDLGFAKAQDDFYTGTVAAACGGTTCIVDYPGFGPKGCDLHHQIQVYHEYARDKAVIDYSFHGIFQHVNKDILDEIKTLVNEGIPSFKGYLTYEYQLTDLDILRLLEKTSSVGGLFTIHAENDAVIQFLRDRFLSQGKTTPRYHALSRPDRCEAEAVQRMIHLSAIAANAPLYIVHLSTAMGLECVRTARNKGQPVYAETCPQYLFLSDTSYDEPDLGGLKYMMSPPIRKRRDSEALWQGIQEGTIDVIATDHCPFDFKLKRQLGKDDFSRSPCGLPGIELRVPLMFSEGVIKGRISPNRFVEIVSTAPAKIMGLYPQKGHIAPGSDADITIIDPERRCFVAHKMLHENVDFTPYEGMNIQGWPILTMVRGQIVAKDGEFLGKKGFGRFLRRSLLG
jgi:dihydropyrimidinase